MKDIKIEIEIGENLTRLLDSFSNAANIRLVLTSIFKSVSDNADKFIKK